MPTSARYTERTIILLSPEQKSWVEAEADERGVSAAQVIREAIDRARGKGR